MSKLVSLDAGKPDHHYASNIYTVRVKASLPFAESDSGWYTHRVRSAILIKLGDRPAHMAIRCWRGMSLLISKRKHGRFVAEPSAGRPVCATCEGRAIGAGQEDSHKINGRMVKFSPRGAEA